MEDQLVRFGIAMEGSLLREFDELVESRGGTRSEALRDLARAAVVRAKIRDDVDAVATLTLVYDHHVRDLSERLTQLQHDLGSRVRSTLHIHLDHDHCLEVIVMEGRSGELQDIAERILALKGVKHGGIELYAWSERGAHRHEHEHAPHRHRSPSNPSRARKSQPVRRRSKT